ncbi:MAG: hypothetical protein LBG07_11370 [Treponema sp.]|jgi:hypothetical protein|nr:hypothetical protein [Treponema sp.]
MIIYLFLLIPVPLLHARGETDDPLGRIDALINAKHFDEAMAALALYMRQNPGDLDRAGKRLGRIAEIQGRYNALVNQLLDAAAGDPGNTELISSLAGELESLEAPRDLRSAELLARIRALAESSVHRKRLGEILGGGRDLSRAGDYPGALRLYQGGLEFFQEEFSAPPYGDGDTPENPAAARILRLSALAGTLESSLAVLDALAKELEDGADVAPEDLRRIYGRIGPELDTLEWIRGEITGAGAFFEGRLRLPGEPEKAAGAAGTSQQGVPPRRAGTGENFPFFAFRLIYGREGEPRRAEDSRREGDFLRAEDSLQVEDSRRGGMIRVIEDCLAERRGSLEALLASGAEEAYGRALEKARGRYYRGAIKDYGEAALRSALLRDFLETQGAALSAAPPPALSAALSSTGEKPGGGDHPDFLSLLCRDFVISCSVKAETLELRLDQRAAEYGGVSGTGETEEFKAALKELSSEAEALEGELREAEESFLRRLGEEASPAGGGPSSSGSGADKITRYTAGALELLENFKSRRMALELDGSLRRYAVFNNTLGERLERRKARLNLAERLMGGLKGEEAAVVLPEAAAVLPEAAVVLPEAAADSPVFPGSPEGDVYHYSREALAVFTELNGELAEDLAYAEDFFTRYGEDQQKIQVSAELGALSSSIGSILEELNGILRRGTEGAALAEEMIGQAETFRDQGDRYYQEAGEKLRRGDFAGARNSIQGAAERYSRALALQEFPSLREEWDTRMLALGQEIGQRENEAVVKDTRDAINQVRTEYLAGNFQQAENLLLRGQNQWMRTNGDENPEIRYWLSMVRDAISLRSGKEIPVTAPLFAEMGQYLSDARGDYEEGAALIRAGRRDEGLARFTNAREHIRKVKFVFPENQEAGMLELMMDQMADPELFTASFQRRFNEALGGIKRHSTEAFGELQNLVKINPSYPGIAAALSQAEIDMGYRPAPPDPEKLRRSAGLTEAARSIVDANDRQHFEAALRQLNEALSLDPNNTQAMGLKDLVQTRMGAGNAVLSSADEGEYQRAVRELQRGNTLISMAIVEQLLRNPRNRGSTRVRELQRRIQSFL